MKEKKRRTMKENALENEVERIKKIRPIGYKSDKRTLKVLSSGPLVEAILRKKGYESETLNDKKPPCYGNYWDRAPTVRNLLYRECMKIIENENSRKRVNCKYHTLDKDGCPVISPSPFSLLIINSGEDHEKIIFGKKSRKSCYRSS